MHRRTVWMWGLAAAAATAAMLWFGNGLNPWWPLMWFAPLPVLLFALRASWPAAALAAFAAWLAASMNLWNYFHRLGMPFAVWLGIFGMVALVAVAVVLLFRALVLRGAVWTALVAFPAAWVTLEYLRNLSTPHGTAGSIAYTQLHFLPFLQLAAITGPWGISFLLSCFPAALAIALHLRKAAPQRSVRVIAVTGAAIAAVLLFGAVRLATAPHAPLVKVGLVASDLASNVDVASRGAATRGLFESYAEQAQQLAARGAEAIVLPEKLGVVLDSDNVTADPIFQRLADNTGATIVVGEVHVTGRSQYNQARVYTPQAAVLSYDKEHMLPPFESSLTPGTALVTLPGPHSQSGQSWGVAICKDFDFTPLSRRYGLAGVGLMLAPAWDFNLDRAWHGHIAVMRGVEDGFSIARAAKDGFLTVSDSRGRILAETRSDSAGFATLLAEVPAAHSATLYQHWGDWFGWLAIGLLLLSLLRLGIGNRDQGLVW